MKKQKFNHGFTLVETLVAISILVMAILGSFTAVQSGLSSSIFSKDQVIAFYLANEGIEQIRNIRDENALKGLPWLTGIANIGSDACNFNGSGSKTCSVDVFNAAAPIARCNASWGSCPILQQDPNTGAYGYFVNGVDTIYRREVQVYPISPVGCINKNPSNCTEVSILVKVTWGKGLVTRTFNARENILDWQ